VSRRDRVLEALRSHPGGISGERIAEELGVSRVAVGKHVAALRESGYRIDALAGTGYVLAEAPDAPLPAEVGRLVTGSRWTLTGGGITGSTNDDAKALAAAGARQGTVVLASAQTGGRGRLGRTWSSPHGGLYLSVVLRPGVEPARVASLSLAIALAVALAAEKLGAHPSLKWPNDVVLASGKIAGVLLEMAAEADCVAWVVAGIGVNVRPPAEREAGVGYLADEVSDAGLALVAAAILDALASVLDRWLAGGFAALEAEFEARSTLSGEAVTVRNSAGGIVADGIASGIDSDGRLLVAETTGVRAVSAGEVTLR